MHPCRRQGCGGKDSEYRDIEQSFQLLESSLSSKKISGTIEIAPIANSNQTNIEGKLFGGCFSVITQLIGTPFFPDLKNHVLFIEDLDEHPGRLLRAWQTWSLSGLTKNLGAVVVGNLRNMGPAIPNNAPFVLNRFAKFTNTPIFHSVDFGHVSPNYPLVVGSTVTIKNDQLEFIYEG